ncbi:MAG: FimV/HubP family polar landmark protein [Polaromonas sp.]|nr:FimV/HubP family polar landmark protein [Polaromonas sp.]
MGALASAMALLGSLASLEAHALALGRITVQSALGEPLRAEIDIAEITSDEASSLKIGAAPADRFKAAGLEYSAAMAALEVSLQRRADGRAYLRLSSNRPVTEPFVDLILEASWSSGRITRDYTLLFDPPNMRYRSAGAAVTPTAPVLSQPLTPNAAPRAREIASPPAAPAARQAPVAKAPAPQQARPAEKTSAANQQLTVKAGDTAGRIAAQTRPASVSLDQMLVALLRSNPDAFIDGNINRIKAGAVLDVPSTEAARATSPSEATQTIVAQSKDFNAFRRKLAQSAPSTQITSADRQDAGKLQAKVEDRAPANVTPDKLTLSKGAVQGKASAAAADDRIAKDRQAADASTRLAELSKNISDLNKLGAAPVLAPAAAPADSDAKAPGAAVPAPPTSLEASADQASTRAAAPLAAVSQPAAAASAASAAATVAAAVAINPVATAAPPPPESGLIDEWIANPLMLPLAGGLLALLAGFGFYRYRRRNKAAQVDSSFLESRLQPDSFFGASGGQRVDTNEGKTTGSSVAYSPSQLDAGGDVDPVAEADVYLAYGRDLQAEEILKEALRTTPMRVAIHGKLLEIYAKRHDSKAFDGVALEAFNLTQGFGPEWAYIAEMGRQVDPDNPMYQPGGQPAAEDYIGEAKKPHPTGTIASFAQAGSAVSAPMTNVDLDLDFSLDDALGVAAIAAPLPNAPPFVLEPTTATVPELTLGDLDMDMDFGSETMAPPAASGGAPDSRPVAPPPLDIVFPSNGLDFTTEPFALPEPVLPTKAADNGMLEFDLGSLSLDLGPAAESPPEAVAVIPHDPLETKFSLAEEFRTLGDAEGARTLAEEVLAEARGPLKVKAQAFLNALS